jgi:hypothetical protein
MERRRNWIARSLDYMRELDEFSFLQGNSLRYIVLAVEKMHSAFMRRLVVMAWFWRLDILQ